MSDKKAKHFQDENVPEYTLIKAEQTGDKFGSVSYSLPLTLSYLGIFSSLVCEFMVVMSALSQPDHAVSYKTMAGGAIVFAVCIAAVFVFNYFEKKSIQKAENERKELLKIITPTDGKIVGINKYIKHIHHSGNVYEQAMWSFNIEYTDSETGEAKTLESEQYLNDVSEVLTDNAVKIYFQDEDEFELDGFSFRTSESDDKYSFTVNETVVGEETVYAFDYVDLKKKKSAEKNKKKK